MRAGIDKLFSIESGQVFVFGSNEAGIHGAGAARMAWQKLGAVWGEGVGHYGQSYAIPTKDMNLSTLPLERILPYVEQFIHYAWEHTELKFFVTRLGCGLAGYMDIDIAPMFAGAPPNCELPYGWEAP